MSFNILMLLISLSNAHHLDPKLVQSVIQVESKWNPRAVGPVGEIGWLQIRPEHVKTPRTALFDPAVNLSVGIPMLAERAEKCRHKADYTFLVCYNRGLAGGARVSNPKKDKYYLKVMAEYRRLKH